MTAVSKHNGHNAAIHYAVYLMLMLLFCVAVFFLVFFIVFPGEFSIGDSHLQPDIRRFAPDGQLLYVLSKVLGITALSLLWWQLFISLVSRKFAVMRACTPGRMMHIVTGILLLLMIVSHAGMFLGAVSLRQGYLAVNLLIPNFTDYYHTALSLGVISLFMVLASVFVALLRRYISDLWFRGHYLVMLAFALVCIHALQIGSEAGSGGMKYLLLFYIFTIALLVLLKLNDARLREKNTVTACGAEL